MKSLTIKTITLALLAAFSLSTLALPKLPGGLGSLGGDDSKDTSSMDLPTAQSKLERTLRDALADLSEAEAHFAEA
ncbi:uncharacterized protein METZ01_LOCUS466876, partial [marine metagenome]